MSDTDMLHPASRPDAAAATPAERAQRAAARRRRMTRAARLAAGIGMMIALSGCIIAPYHPYHPYYRPYYYGY